MSSGPSNEADSCKEARHLREKGKMVLEAGSQPTRLWRPVLVLARTPAGVSKDGKDTGRLRGPLCPRKGCRVQGLAEPSSRVQRVLAGIAK